MYFFKIKQTCIYLKLSLPWEQTENHHNAFSCKSLLYPKALWEEPFLSFLLYKEETDPHELNFECWAEPELNPRSRSHSPSPYLTTALHDQLLWLTDDTNVPALCHSLSRKVKEPSIPCVVDLVYCLHYGSPKLQENSSCRTLRVPVPAGSEWLIKLPVAFGWGDRGRT